VLNQGVAFDYRPLEDHHSGRNRDRSHRRACLRVAQQLGSDEPGSSAPTVAHESDAESPDAVDTGSTTNPEQDSTAGPTDLEPSLRTLGVDTSASARVAPNQEALP